MRLLVALFLLLSLPTVAQAQTWTVDVMPAVDSSIAMVMDSASAEPAFCLGVDVDSTAHHVLVWQELPATIVHGRQTRDMVQFACPAGAAIAHGHFLVHDEVDGPSDTDLRVLQSLHGADRPPVAIIVAQARDRESIHFIAY